MTTYYCRTDGSDSNAGTTDSSGGAFRNLSAAIAVVAAGDTVMIRASAGNASSYPTSSLDYTISSFFNTPTGGSASGGYVKWIGYNGMPTIGSPGLGFYNAAYYWFEGLYFVATSNGNASLGILNPVNGGVVKGCVINTNSQANMVGVKFNNTGEILNTEIYSGSTSPTSSSGAYGVDCGNYAVLVQGCRIRYCRDHGVYSSTNLSSAQVLNNLIYGNAGDGVYLTQTDTSVSLARVIGNTINGNGGHGVNVDGTNGAIGTVIRNNNITNHAQASKYGINVTTASSDKRKAAWGWNNVWNNTGAYNNVTADSTDLAVDPGYVSSSTGNFTPTNVLLRGAAIPITFPGG